MRLFGDRGADTSLLRAAKNLVGRAIVTAAGREGGVAGAGLLADTTYGAEALAMARSAGLLTAAPVEESGRRWFALETPDWRRRATEAADIVKVLVRWNPDDPKPARDEQAAEIAKVASFASSAALPFLFELLVPPTEAQLSEYGDQQRFDREARAALTARAIGQLHEAGIEPTWWKLEGFDTTAECALVSSAARAEGRAAGCLVLGRGADAGKVDDWLRAAAPVDGFTGFAIGRSTFWPALGQWAAGELSDDDAVERIASAYLHFVDVWQAARTATEPTSPSAPATSNAGQHVRSEIASQPQMWRKAAALAAEAATKLTGNRMAFVGCGTSFYIAQTLATLWESKGRGEADAFCASEMPIRNSYDQVVVLSRSGTTTEVTDVLSRLDDMNRVAIVGVDPSPVSRAADLVIPLDFADEQSVVQTRFATSVVALFRGLLGDDVEELALAAETALARPLPDTGDATHFVFLGTGAGVGLAHEAALKFREAALAGTESYPALEYRHGPIALADPHTVVWFFGVPPGGLVDEITETGARVIAHDADPLVELVLAQRVAIAIAAGKGLDPDRPRHLARSVVLPASA